MIFARANFINVSRICRCHCGRIGGTGAGFGGKGSGGGFGAGGFRLGGFRFLGMASPVLRSMLQSTPARENVSGKRSGSFGYAGRLIASGAAISVCHPAAIYRRWRTFLYCRISAGIRIASQIRQSSFPDLARLAARCVASPIREQRRASIRRASDFRLVSRAAA